MGFRRSEREQQDRTQITPQKDFTIKPNRLIRCGRHLSASARVLYDVIASYNPSFPGYKQLQIDSGFAKERIRNALDELEIKCIIYRVSGYAKREVNEYFLRPDTEWKLLDKAIPPSKRRKPKKKQFDTSSIIELVRVWTKKQFWGVTSSIIELGPSSIIEQELDQLQEDQYPSDNDPASLVSGYALRHGCPVGHEEKKIPEKGGRLTAADIERNRQAQLTTLRAQIELETPAPF